MKAISTFRQLTGTGPKSAAVSPRYRLLDAARGVALLAMVAYHVTWDLVYLGVYPVDISVEPGWIGFQLAILGSFVLLAGMSLVLAHGTTIRWRAFWRREAVLAAAAIAVSIGTAIAFSEYFAFFGILHALVLFSLLALPFLRMPIWVAAATAVVVIVAPFVLHDVAFESRWLAWIGFWPEPPATVDLVPIFPWFGVHLGGVVLMRLVLNSRWRERLAGWSGGSIGAGLGFLGRWSLLIYLLHQPLIYGALSGIVALTGSPAPAAQLMGAEAFAQSCHPSCTATGTTAEACTAYCACALQTIDDADLWDALDTPEPTLEQQSAVVAVEKQCRLEAIPTTD